MNLKIQQSRGEHGSVWVGYRGYPIPDPRGADLKNSTRNPHLLILIRRVAGGAGRVNTRSEQIYQIYQIDYHQI
jgi:hypothetical protein